MTWSFWQRVLDAISDASRVERGPEPAVVIPIEPVVISSIEDVTPKTPIDAKGWFAHEKVLVVPSRKSWCYNKLDTPNGLPLGIVAHYTATDAGTAMGMAVRRRDHDRKEFEPHPPGSWHFTVPQKGTQIIQQLSIRQGAFHAGSPTARRLPIGWANHVALGIELEGHGSTFTDSQIELAKWLWRMLVQAAQIPRAHAMHEHSWIDPSRRQDPGKNWMQNHAGPVLDFAYS